MMGRCLLAAFASVTAFISFADAQEPSKAKLLEVFESRAALKILLPYSNEIIPLGITWEFERHFPPHLCDLKHQFDQRETVLTIRYECPAFYKGQPMQFFFSAKKSDPEWTLTRLQIDGRLVASSLLKDFADDFLADGFGSYRRQIDEIGSLEVSVRGGGGLGIYGPLHRLISYYEDNSYRCGVERQTSERLEVACVFYSEAQHQLNNDDQWHFRLRVVNEKELELQKAFGTLLKSDLTPQQIQELADSIFKW